MSYSSTTAAPTCSGRTTRRCSAYRCGACLNVCPVYRKTGGAAYGLVYSGPMGAVLLPLLVGLDHAPSARVLALRSLHRRLPGQDPAPRTAARPAQGPGPRDRRCAALGAPRVRALVSRVVVAARLPGLDSRRACTAGPRRGRRAGPRRGAREGSPAAGASLPERPMSIDLVIRGARLPRRGAASVADVAVGDGRIEAVAPSLGRDRGHRGPWTARGSCSPRASSTCMRTRRCARSTSRCSTRRSRRASPPS